ncbi:MAG: hypothetical protein AB1465_01960 [Patescibacteria group bacterium]
MTQILTFDEVARLNIFPLIVGVDQIRRFLPLSYPPGLLCGFSEEEILAFERQAREDFDIPKNRKPPVAMVLVPAKTLNNANDKVNLTLERFLLTFGITAMYDTDGAKTINEGIGFLLQKILKELERCFASIDFKHLVLMTYLVPNPVYLGKEPSAQKRLARDRGEVIFDFAEAIFCQLMLRCSMSEIIGFNVGEEKPDLPRLSNIPFFSIIDFQINPIVFYFDRGYHGLYYRPMHNNEKILACVGKIGYLY